MQDNPSTLEGILDIEAPAIPSAYLAEQNLLGIAGTSLIVLGLAIMLVYLLRRRYFSPRGKARHRLALLKKHFDKALLGGHDTAFLLAGILRDGLNLQQISPRTELPGQLAAQQHNWQAFNERLATARYCRDEPAATQIASLLDDAQYWLKHWPKIRS
jgi:hypothetical protein